jgi:peptidoglycan/LPS O-acetylase OafA/YrhL
LAVVLVVAFHASPGAVQGGFIGVDVFYVISGYLITGLILKEQSTDCFSIKRFYARRARRILPALTVVIAATLVIGGFVLLPSPYERLGLHAMAGALFFPNILYWSEAGYFDASAQMKPLLHLWSLGVEEQFYLVWPLLMVLLRRWKVAPSPILCGLSVVSLIYSSIAVFYEPVAAFYSPLSRMWELGVGGVLASRRVKVPYPEIVSWLGIVLIVGISFVKLKNAPFPGLLAIVPVGGAAMVIAAGSSALTWRPLVALGLISYPLYLWHWPLLSFARICNEPAFVKIATVPLSICLAWVTNRYIEYPVRFGSLRSFGAAISGSTMFAVSLVAFVIFYSGGLPNRYPKGIQRVFAIMEYEYRSPGRYGRCWLDQWSKFDVYEPQCRNGEILIWGDSVSALLGTGLPKPYAQFSRDSCLPLLATRDDEFVIAEQKESSLGSRRLGEQCLKSNARIVDEILQLKPRRVILFGAWLFHVANWQSDPKLTESMRLTLHKLRSGIDDVILVGPSPAWLPSLPQTVFEFWSKFGALPDRLKVPPEDYQATDTVLRDIAADEHVRFISIFDALCNAEGCLSHTPESRSELLMFDHAHMTIDGATYVVEKLGLAQLGRPQAQ